MVKYNDINLIGRDGFFKNKKGKAWEHYSDKICKVIGYDDDSRTGLIVVFRDGQKLGIQTEEFELLVN